MNKDDLHDIAGRLEKRFEENLKHSREIIYQAWKARPLGEKVLELVTLPIEEEL